MAISSARLSGSPGNYSDPLWRMVVPALLPPSPAGEVGASSWIVGSLTRTATLVTGPSI
jgi:hypothetical protein